MDTKGLTSKDITTGLLYRCYGSGRCGLPNVGYAIGEADWLEVTRSGYVYDYEIKVSRRDFKADFRKRKHKRLKDGPSARRQIIPKLFYFVTPVGLVREHEVPDYAGLIEVAWHDGQNAKEPYCRVVKKPIAIKWCTKLNGDEWHRLLSSAAIRFVYPTVESRSES